MSKNSKTGEIDDSFKAFFSQMQQIASIKAKHKFEDKFGKEEYWDFELFGAFESDGTKKFAYLSMIFDKAISENQILIIDELETSLHPELLFLMICLTYIIVVVNDITNKLFILEDQSIQNDIGN
jgi:predicted ATPase